MEPPGLCVGLSIVPQSSHVVVMHLCHPMAPLGVLVSEALCGSKSISCLFAVWDIMFGAQCLGGVHSYVAHCAHCVWHAGNIMVRICLVATAW